MLTSKQIEFCKQYINGLDASNAYSIAFNKENNGSIRSASSRLLKRKEIQSYISELQEQNKKIVEMANEKAKDTIIAGSIANSSERMMTLTKILRGELVINTEQMTKDGPATITLSPEYNDRIKAIAELNKMDGSYAPTQTKIELSKEQPLFPDVQTNNLNQ
jgi:phage terminase small subunit